MDPLEKFRKEREADIKKMGEDEELHKKSLDWMQHADRYKYTYNFRWLGRPIIKYPNDIVAAQELIWKVKPDVILETGIAHGGSIVFSASMLELIGKGEVVAVDIDIREHNREKIENHRMFKRITMYEGSSTDPQIVEKLQDHIQRDHSVMVFLDSLHTHDHVLDELNIYSPMVTPGSYIVLPDTFIEYFPEGYYDDRPWDVGNNPMTAVRAFLEENDHFEPDQELNDKLCITEGFDGYLKRIH